jgi:5-methylcytosine-specific restriction endonuclease McrA
MARDYKKEYAASRRPDRRKANILRKRARRLMIREKGEAALRGKEVDHKKMLATGGSNARSNLTILSRKANRKKQPKRK